MTDCFLTNVLTLSVDSIPDRVFALAKNCFVDFLACTLAGAKELSKKDLAYIDAADSGCNVVSVLGLQRMCSLQTAALINGINSHVMELDDGHRKGAVHVGGTIFAALLPVAEKEKLALRDVLYGAVIGYEVTVRLACAIQPGNKLRGYHATGTCGTVGATMAIAAALHFDFDQMKSAFSAAITAAAGVLEMQEDNADLKPLNVGRAAMDAVSCAYLGKTRFKAPNDALGGKRGFLKVMTDNIKPEFLTIFEKGTFCIESIYNKPYAACRHTHPAIEAVLQMRKSSQFNVEDVNSILVETYKLAVAGHDHANVSGISSAKMSMPYSVAVALVTGRAGVEEFTERYIKNTRILDIASKVTVVENEELTCLCPQKRASIVTISLKHCKISRRVDFPKGEPENPLSESEFQQKIYELLMFAGYSETFFEKLWTISYASELEMDSVISLLR